VFTPVKVTLPPLALLTMLSAPGVPLAASAITPVNVEVWPFWSMVPPAAPIESALATDALSTRSVPPLNTGFTLVPRLLDEKYGVLVSMSEGGTPPVVATALPVNVPGFDAT
jgi:hypothetical protein